MRTAVVSPILGEFGWIVFDIAPRVRTFFDLCEDYEKVVYCQPEHRYFFEGADIFHDIPDEVMPKYPALCRSYHVARDPLPLGRLMQWFRREIGERDIVLDIPYENQRINEGWKIRPTWKKLVAQCEFQDTGVTKYIVLACRQRLNLGAKKNWPPSKWDRLVAMLRQRLGWPIYCIGQVGASYKPPHAFWVEGDIERAVAAFNGALFSVSSNSGPTHLSLMTGCPTFSWGQASNKLKQRMEELTNPLLAPCLYAKLGWQPTVEEVWKQLEPWISIVLGDKAAV